MPDPKPSEEQAELAAEQRRQTQERRTTAAFAFFLVLVTLGSLWLAGVLEWAVRVFRGLAGG